MAPLVKKLQEIPEAFQTIVCVTGQHREMLDQVLRLFEITPDYDLNIMKPNQDLYDITSRILLGMRDVLKEVQPDIVLVHGDTTTSMAAALAAFYQQIPVKRMMNRSTWLCRVVKRPNRCLPCGQTNIKIR